MEFLQANPIWAQKLYIAKERFIRSPAFFVVEAFIVEQSLISPAVELLQGLVNATCVVNRT